MKAKAPGKLVVSGAYAVLRGAPALVTAVERHVVADDERAPEFRTNEVSAALSLLGRSDEHPYFDASELRQDGRKLGLGSSAAICAASVALLMRRDLSARGAPTDADIARGVYDVALLAHRTAQGGGSGIDVAAACFGGTLRAVISGDEDRKDLAVTGAHLPLDLVIETWASPKAASTSEFVSRVFSLESRAPREFSRLFSPQIEASRQAVDSVERGDPAEFIEALSAQTRALLALGAAAGVPIVLPEVDSLQACLEKGEAFLPSGAGGGDVTLFVARHESSDAFRQQARQKHFELIPLGLGARGVHLFDE